MAANKPSAMETELDALQRKIMDLESKLNNKPVVSEPPALQSEPESYYEKAFAVASQLKEKDMTNHIESVKPK